MEPQILVMSSNLIIWGLMMPSIPFASKRNGEFSYTDSQNALARRVFDYKHNYDYLSRITDPPLVGDLGMVVRRSFLLVLLCSHSESCKQLCPH